MLSDLIYLIYVTISIVIFTKELGHIKVVALIRRESLRNYHNFALTSVLQNDFNLNHSINGKNPTEESFCDFFCHLADEIAHFARIML